MKFKFKLLVIAVILINSVPLVAMEEENVFERVDSGGNNDDASESDSPGLSPRSKKIFKWCVAKNITRGITSGVLYGTTIATGATILSSVSDFFSLQDLIKIRAHTAILITGLATPVLKKAGFLKMLSAKWDIFETGDCSVMFGNEIGKDTYDGIRQRELKLFVTKYMYNTACGLSALATLGLIYKYGR